MLLMAFLEVSLGSPGQNEEDGRIALPRRGEEEFAFRGKGGEEGVAFLLKGAVACRHRGAELDEADLLHTGELCIRSLVKERGG